MDIGFFRGFFFQSLARGYTRVTFEHLGDLRRFWGCLVAKPQPLFLVILDGSNHLALDLGQGFPGKLDAGGQDVSPAPKVLRNLHHIALGYLGP